MYAATKPLPWFALRVRARSAKTTATLLGHKGYEWFLPLYKSKRRWSDRVKELELPLFPGYLFCRLDLDNRLPVLQTPGVVNIVGIGKTPIPLEDEEISAIQCIVKSGLSAQPWPFLQLGQQVRIDRGPLSGLEGIVVHLKSQHRLVVSIKLLERSVAVEIEAGWVMALRP
ncbi:MAG: NusG-like protein [Acidobacteria bacterium]|nr:MAG: NusG-like protein [Acidobacteriota bacterium]